MAALYFIYSKAEVAPASIKGDCIYVQATAYQIMRLRGTPYFPSNMVTLVLPLKRMKIRGYIDGQGRRRFKEWFEELDPAAAAKVAMALTRMEQGNLSNVKGVGGGVFEYRINFGPGYRIYFGKDGQKIVILLGGGTKRGQQKDIDAALLCWADYKRRKKQENIDAIDT